MNRNVFLQLPDEFTERVSELLVHESVYFLQRDVVFFRKSGNNHGVNDLGFEVLCPKHSHSKVHISVAY